MASPRLERALIRTLVAIALCIAILACALTPIPRDARGNPTLPAIAFEQTGLYRLEVALLVFYGGLLLVTPAFSGLIWGRLPTEISARGAKFPQKADQSADVTRAAIVKLKETTDGLTEELIAANVKIERLKEVPRSDSRQPEVDSKR